jgi:EAL domain-containing protein (putative c-di-GMP-specific phosphodiesterase class I)
MALITEIGCDEAQGYLLGRPTSDPAQFFQPEEALVALVELRRAAGD